MAFSCTENEAKNYGIFLSELLKQLTSWHKEKTMYDVECLSTPGFIRKSGVEDVSPVYYEWSDFQRLMHKWHLKMKRVFLFLDII